MGDSVSGCPVPSEQQPMNEYKSLQDSWFFRWVTLDLNVYIKRIALLWILGAVLSFPVARDSFTLAEAPIRCVLLMAVGATIGLSLILLRLYLGWSYICDRLLSPSIAYEETGWYDGQSWQKTAAELAQDQLIGIYQVRPILRRLRYSFAGLIVLLICGTCLWRGL